MKISQCWLGLLLRAQQFCSKELIHILQREAGSTHQGQRFFWILFLWIQFSLYSGWVKGSASFEVLSTVCTLHQGPSSPGWVETTVNSMWFLASLHCSKEILLPNKDMTKSTIMRDANKHNTAMAAFLTLPNPHQRRNKTSGGKGGHCS